MSTTTTHDRGGTTFVRRHPDIFTGEEAATYLGMESERSLDTIRRDYGLVGHKIGKALMYHRKELDRVALKMFGVTAEPSQDLKTGGRR